MNRLSPVLVSVACAGFVIAWSAGWSRADSKPELTAPAAANDEAPRAKLSRESSAHAILLSVFKESGWSTHHALVYTNNAMARLGIEGYSISEPPPPPKGNPMPGHALLSPSTDVHATLMGVFIATGWSTAEAIAHTDYCLEKEGLPAALDADPCQVWVVNIQYCEGESKKYFQGFVHTLCYEQLWPSPLPAPCALPNCIGGNVPWFTLNTTLGCSMGYIGCVRVQFVEQITVRCSPSILGCSCFVENSCDDITDNIECCPPLTISGSGGCSGCPCDD